MSKDPGENLSFADRLTCLENAVKRLYDQKEAQESRKAFLDEFVANLRRGLSPMDAQLAAEKTSADQEGHVGR